MAITVLQPSSHFFSLSGTNWIDSTLDAPATVPDNAQITITFTVAPNNEPQSIDFELTGAEWNNRTNAVIGSAPDLNQLDVLRSADFVSLNFNTYNLNFGGTADGSFVFGNGTGVTGVVSSIIGLRIAIDDHIPPEAGGVDEDEVNRLIEAALDKRFPEGQNTTALQIISLDYFKQQCNLPLTHNSENARLTAIISQAVDFVSKDTGLRFIAENKIAYAPFPEKNTDPITVNVKSFQFNPVNANHHIIYWGENDSLNAAPNNSVDAANIGRVVQTDDATIIYPSSPWPSDVLENTNAVIQGSIVSNVAEGVKAAMILYAKFLRSGKMEDKFLSGYNRAVWPYRKVAV